MSTKSFRNRQHNNMFSVYVVYSELLFKALGNTRKTIQHANYKTPRVGSIRMACKLCT